MAIADDSALFREGLASMLQAVGVEVSGQASDAGELLDIVAADPPGAVIVDIRMPPTHTDEGRTVVRKIRSHHPQVGCLVLSAYLETEIAYELLEQGRRGVGYLLKDSVADVEELVDGLRTIARGGSVVDPQVVAASLVGLDARAPSTG